VRSADRGTRGQLPPPTLLEHVEACYDAEHRDDDHDRDEDGS
jgi:hypothetical protein